MTPTRRAVGRCRSTWMSRPTPAARRTPAAVCWPKGWCRRWCRHKLDGRRRRPGRGMRRDGGAGVTRDEPLAGLLMFCRALGQGQGPSSSGTRVSVGGPHLHRSEPGRPESPVRIERRTVLAPVGDDAAHVFRQEVDGAEAIRKVIQVGGKVLVVEVEVLAA